MYHFKKAKGIYLIDENGKKYIDLISGIAVNNIGHRNKKVIKAIKRQLKYSLHQMVYGEYLIQPQVRLAQKLVSFLPSPLESVYLLNSGSEAIEGALKLAKKATGRSKIVAFRNAYHGSTTGALSLMDNAYYSQAFKPLLPQVGFAQINDLASLEIIDQQTAAVFIEPVQGESGYHVVDANFLKELRHCCDQNGVLLVFDEIQSGMGRTGKFLAMEHSEVVPDILCMAKGLGGGMPISCFVASKKLMSELSDHPILGHITTFGGHPLSSAAALATLEYLQEKNLMTQVEAKEQLFRTLLKHDKIKGISGKGLMLAVQLESFEMVTQTIERCFEDGLITDWFLYANTALRISPPLTITEAEIKKVCEILLKALSD